MYQEYQEVCFNRGTEAGRGGGGGVNVGHLLSPPGHFMLATGLIYQHCNASVFFKNEKKST